MQGLGRALVRAQVRRALAALAAASDAVWVASFLAGSPICIVKCLFDISDPFLYLPRHLLRSTLRLLFFVARQFTNLLLYLARDVLSGALDLIPVHGYSYSIRGYPRNAS
jgi:hypothetical protein